MGWTTYICGYCSAENDVDIDISAGRRQEFIEDCQTCCRPNLLRVELDPDGDALIVDAQPENG